MIDVVATFIVFFAVIDPIGTVPVFIGTTKQVDEARRRHIALIAVIAAAGILMFFVLAGEILLIQLGISLAAFQLAGGVILFLFALSMIFGNSKPEEELRLLQGRTESAIFPLAMPSIASPGAILAAVLLTENSRVSLFEQVQVSLVMLAVLGVQLALLLGASFIHRFLGDAGASVISRVMGMLLAAVATVNVVQGITDSFNL